MNFRLGNYQIHIWNSLAALENLSYSKDLSRGWENVKENIKTSAKECHDPYHFMQHNPCFDEECLRFLDRRKQVKM